MTPTPPRRWSSLLQMALVIGLPDRRKAAHNLAPKGRFSDRVELYASGVR